MPIRLTSHRKFIIEDKGRNFIALSANVDKRGVICALSKVKNLVRCDF